MNTLWTAAEWALLQDVVHAAAGMSRGERTVYLEEACKGQPKLRTRAESLLDALDSENSGFGEAIGAAASMRLEGEPPAEGTRIGPYRIVGVLGRGGMLEEGDPGEARKHYERALAARTKVIPPGRPAITESWLNLGESDGELEPIQ